MKNDSLSFHQELEKREKELIAKLSDNHEVIWHLRANSKFLGDDEWKRLLQTNPHLFDDNNRTLDSFMLEY